LRSILERSDRNAGETVKEEQCYITMDAQWAAKTCPVCKDQEANAHGWLFREPPPARSLEDKRKAIGEVFMHTTGEDCTIVIR